MGKKRSGSKVERRTSRTEGRRAQAAVERNEESERPLAGLLTDLAAGLTSSAIRLTAETAVPFLRAEVLTPRRRKLMRETGLYLRDLREVAGLTLDALSKALDLKDHSVLEAAERGTATLSFELILRLAALLARHDPIPFVLRFVRTYNPAIWKVLEGWGIGRLPAHFERQHQFSNIYRQYDAARKLSDAGFAQVLAFTQAAFEMSLHFATQNEGIKDAGRKTPPE